MRSWGLCVYNIHFHVQLDYFEKISHFLFHLTRDFGSIGRICLAWWDGKCYEIELGMDVLEAMDPDMVLGTCFPFIGGD